MGFALRFRLSDFTVNSCFRMIIHPFAHKYLPFLIKEVGALSFSFIIHPLSFEVVSVSARQHSKAWFLAFKPKAFIDVSLSVDHSAFAVREIIKPGAIVTVTIQKVLGSTAGFAVISPIAGIFFPQFILLRDYPHRAFAVTEVVLPAAFITVLIIIILNSESMFFIVFPVAIVAAILTPFLSFDSTIFGFLLFFNPVNGAVRAVLLGFCIIFLP